MSWSWRDAHDDFEPDNFGECSKCIHRIAYNDPNFGCKKGCEEWDCCFEETPPMTIEDAIDIFNDEVEIDYGDRGEMEIEKIDKALDLIIATVRRYLKKDCAEWNEWIDGHLGVKTDAGTCSKCGAYNKYQTKFCPHCGRQMREWKKSEESK